MIFEKILNQVKAAPKVVAVAAAHDIEVLEAVITAKNQGIAIPVLVGDKKKIFEIAEKISADLSGIEIVDKADNMEAALYASRLVKDGNADYLMKGFLQTAELLKAVLDKENGLRSGNLISHISIVESPNYDRLLFYTDCGMVMYPDLKQKIELINNSVLLAKSLGVSVPKVAVMGAMELVNPDMPATLDAAILSQMNRRGQIKGCVVDGPLGFDLAVSQEAAEHKGVKGSEVAGFADIILVPNIDAGNGIYKSATKLAHCQSAGVIVGASAPIVLTSRADTAESKIFSIACASMLSSYLKNNS